jgi:hypothetical protein
MATVSIILEDDDEGQEIERREPRAIPDGAYGLVKLTTCVPFPARGDLYCPSTPKEYPA